MIERVRDPSNGRVLGTVRVYGGKLTGPELACIAQVFAAARARTGHHDCLGEDCGARLPEDRAFCDFHWQLIPPHLRQAITAAWRPGQTAATASTEYLQAVHEAQQALAADKAAFLAARDAQHRRPPHARRSGRGR